MPILVTKQHVKCSCVIICVQLFVTPKTIALQVPLSMGFPRQEYWSGLPFFLQGIFLTQVFCIAGRLFSL